MDGDRVGGTTCCVVARGKSEYFRKCLLSSHRDERVFEMADLMDEVIGNNSNVQIPSNFSGETAENDAEVSLKSQFSLE